MSKAQNNLEKDEMFIRVETQKAQLEKREYELEYTRVIDAPDMDEYRKYLMEQYNRADSKYATLCRMQMYINHFRMYIKEVEKANAIR